MKFVDRFKKGFARTVEEEAIVKQAKEVERYGDVFLLIMGNPIRGITRRVIDGIKCVFDPTLKSEREREAKTLLAIMAANKEAKRSDARN